MLSILLPSCAIIALLLLRDLRPAGQKQKVCSEIVEPKNRVLAATTEINDIVISNEMVSMVLAQITHEPRMAAILEDFFRSEGSEIYLKAMRIYAELGQPERNEEQAGLVDVPVVAVDDVNLRLVAVEAAAQPVGGHRASGAAAQNHDLFPRHSAHLLGMH